jgi:aminomethyltransferase
MPRYPEIPIAFGARVRPSPYFEATLKHNPGAFSVYNRMLIPMFYKGVEEDYWDLIERVSVWDVGAERQVEITGPDAASFTQYLVTRDVTRIAPGRARYTLICQHDGGILNDPVLLRLAENHFWFSLADSDIQLWAKGVAQDSGFDVEIREPDVSPLQVQGPHSVDVMQKLFGSHVHDLGFYHFIETELDGIPMVVARTGWSGEVGFEIFLRDGSKGRWLWERLFEVGEPYDIAPGAPNNIRRMEAGLLSWGTDMDWDMNPIEMGLQRFVDLDCADDFIGKEAILRVATRGPERRHIGLIIEGEPIRQGPVRWWPVSVGEAEIGIVTSAVWSPGMQENIAYGMLGLEHVEVGNQVTVDAPDGKRRALVTTMPFVDPRYRG